MLLLGVIPHSPADYASAFFSKDSVNEHVVADQHVGCCKGQSSNSCLKEEEKETQGTHKEKSFKAR